MKALTTDEVFDIIGHLGRGHLLYMAIVSVLTFFVASHMVLNIFTGLEPHFSCIPFLPSESTPYKGVSHHLEPVPVYLPTTNDSSSPQPASAASLGSSAAGLSKLGISSVSIQGDSPSAAARHKRDKEPSQRNQNLSILAASGDVQPTLNTQPIIAGEDMPKLRALPSAPEQQSGALEGTGPAVAVDGSAVTEAPLRDQCPDNDLANCRIVYDEGFRSIVQEWGLVCRAKQRVAEVQAAWMTGVMTGALLLARLPDMYGRSNTLLVATLGTVAFEGLASFTDHFAVYVVLRLLGGAMCSIVILACFVLSQELVGASKRSLVGVISSAAFSLGIALLAAVAKTTDNWRTLTLMLSVAGVPCAGLLLLLPESPRWLASKGRLEEAAQVLQRIGRLNGTAGALPQQWRLLPSGAETGSSLKGEPLLLSDEDGEPGSVGWLGRNKKRIKSKRVKKVLQQLDEKSASLREMLRHGYIARLLVILIYSWFVNSAVYYGLTLAASDLGSNIYLSTALNGLVELPSNLIVLLVIDRLGRRSTLVGFMVCGGVACLLVPLLPPINPAYTGLALLGKLCISASFTVAYIHSGEIFPTCMRNTGIGLLSVSARTGGIVCPFILMLGDVAPGLHFAVLGLLAVTSGLLNMTLPETLGRPTPETVEDVLAFKTGRPVSSSQSSYSRLLADEEADGGSSGEENEVVELDMMTRGAGDKRPLVE